MTRISFIVAAFLLLTVPVIAGQPVKGEVRDASGKLIHRTTTRENKTEVRSPSGKLLYKTKTKDGKTEVRSPSGKLIQKSK